MRPIARIAALAGLVLACALVLHHEGTAVPWRAFAKELSPKDHLNFLWPLDTRSKGVSVDVESGPGGDFLWAFGPATELAFSTHRPMDLELAFALDNPVAGQDLEVRLGGRVVAAFRNIPPGPLGTPQTPHRVAFRSLAGANTVTLVYGRFNHHGGSFAQGDPRPLAGRFTLLRLLPVVDGRRGS